MVVRIPLIVNSSANQIQELPVGDTFQGLVAAGSTFGNIQIAVTNANRIDTTTGDLELDAAGNDVIVQSTSELIVNKSTDAIDSTDGGAVTILGGLAVRKKIFAGDDIAAFNTSDERLKDNITPIPNALSKVISISGNTFNWNEASDYEGKADVGVIAQEIEKIDLPGIATTRDDGTKAVRYEKIIPLLIEAIKELKSEVDELKSHTH